MNIREWFTGDDGKPRLRANFTPQKDITAHELAVILSKTLFELRGPVSFTAVQWHDQIDNAIRRHFTLETDHKSD